MRRLLVVAAPMIALLACRDRSGDTDTTSAAAAVAGETTRAATGGDIQRALLDPNTSTREQLAAAPGVDSAVVTVIIAGRPWSDMVALDKALARNMNAEQRKALYARVWKRIDLNTATGEEILLIPGVGPRMRHEFEEYRPYRSIEQFRREIGKYVDTDEVARLEQYVIVK